jgi:hypothetical protein
MDYGGWLVYVPALDTPSFRGGGLMATRRVTWHLRLKPMRGSTTGMTKSVTTEGAVVTPEGTEIEIKVSDLVKVTPLDFSDIDEFNVLARREAEKDMNERLTFIRSAVDCIMDSERPSLHVAANQVSGKDINDHDPKDEPCCLMEGGSNVGVSFSGQRSFEPEEHDGDNEPKRGRCAGASVELMKKGTARLIATGTLSEAM